MLFKTACYKISLMQCYIHSPKFNQLFAPSYVKSTGKDTYLASVTFNCGTRYCHTVTEI
jgi:hypothetical protein